jgi:predicted DNA-binding transcriptional regulator AlpA
MMRKTRPHAASERVGCNQTPARLALSQIRPVPRRGLSRSESAMYIGISPSKFDALVYDGRMPRALQIDRRKVWDQRELDVAFDAFRIDNDSDDEGWADFAVGSGK